jgi:hypothetical protein
MSFGGYSNGVLLFCGRVIPDSMDGLVIGDGRRAKFDEVAVSAVVSGGGGCVAGGVWWRWRRRGQFRHVELRIRQY